MRILFKNKYTKNSKPVVVYGNTFCNRFFKLLVKSKLEVSDHLKQGDDMIRLIACYPVYRSAIREIIIGEKIYHYYKGISETGYQIYISLDGMCYQKMFIQFVGGLPCNQKLSNLVRSILCQNSLN